MVVPGCSAVCQIGWFGFTYCRWFVVLTGVLSTCFACLYVIICLVVFAFIECFGVLSLGCGVCYVIPVSVLVVVLSLNCLLFCLFVNFGV